MDTVTYEEFFDEEIGLSGMEFTCPDGKKYWLVEVFPVAYKVDGLKIRFSEHSFSYVCEYCREERCHESITVRSKAELSQVIKAFLKDSAELREKNKAERKAAKVLADEKRQVRLAEERRKQAWFEEKERYRKNLAKAKKGQK